MVWVDVAERQADNERSLHAGAMLSTQRNLDLAYEQSGFDLSGPDRLGYYTTIVNIGLNGKWLDAYEFGKMPIPARPARTGIVNPIRISFFTMVSGPATDIRARVYLLGGSGSQAVSETEGFPGEESYDEKTVSVVGGWNYLEFDPVYPRTVIPLHGGGAGPAGLVIPFVWLRVLLWADSAVETIDFRSLRIREIPE